MWNSWKRLGLAALVLTILLASYAYALRASRPYTLTYPITEEQISQLNKYLEDIWNMQKGRFEVDIVTTTKTSARNGEFWIISTGSTSKIQFKSGDHIYTVNSF